MFIEQKLREMMKRCHVLFVRWKWFSTYIRRRLNGLTVSHEFEHVSQNRLYVMRMMKIKDAQHKTSGEIELER